MLNYDILCKPYVVSFNAGLKSEDFALRLKLKMT